MKLKALTIITIFAAILYAGATKNLSAQSTSYDFDNTSGKYVDMSKPILITMKFVETDSDESLCEYCRYDAQGRIIEYGCLVGQFDYETYIRMFKIHYGGKKIDSIQWKEVMCGYASDKKDLIFKKGISFYDQFTSQETGYYRDTDKGVKGLDPKSIASMRAYAESKDDILERQFGRMYDFSGIKKWDKEKKDNLGFLTYSEIQESYDEEYEIYKINYSYLIEYTKLPINLKKRTIYDGEIYDSEYDYVVYEKYLHTDTDPRKEK